MCECVCVYMNMRCTHWEGLHNNDYGLGVLTGLQTWNSQGLREAHVHFRKEKTLRLISLNYFTRHFSRGSLFPSDAHASALIKNNIISGSTHSL